MNTASTQIVEMSQIGVRKPRRNHKESLMLLRKGQVVTLPAKDRETAEKLRASLVASLRRWTTDKERLLTTVLEEHPDRRDPFPRVEALLMPYYRPTRLAPEARRGTAKRNRHAKQHLNKGKEKQ